jgi:hypothetical protein
LGLWKITPEHCWNWKSGFHRKKPVGNIWRLFDGHEALFANDAKLVNIGWAAVAAKFVLAVGIKLQ